jgi:hypothetical protein
MTCQRPDPTATCPHCTARPDEDCPLTDTVPGLLEDKPITAGKSGTCDDDVCESCQ